MITITPTISISEDELRFTYMRASGPGGQHVNKVSTAVQLRFDVAGSPSLAADLKQRLLTLAGKRATNEGEIVLSGQQFRSQEQNRTDTLERLATLIRSAAHKPKPRRPTAPGKGAIRRRLTDKKIRSETKGARRRSGSGEDE